MAQSSKIPQPASTPAPVPASEMTLARMGAQSQLEFELSFFGSILDRHPSYLEMLRQHAKNLTTVKRHSESLQMDRRIVQLSPTDPQAHYELACAHAVLHQSEQAIHALRKAVDLGYRDSQVLRKNRDLESIRKDPRFRQILRELEK